MNWKNVFTPKDTEEVKPGFFVQKKWGNYRQIQPLVWDGKYRWKAQMKTVFSWSTFFRIAVVLFIVWAYLNDTSGLREFYFEVQKNPVEWCYGVLNNITESIQCTDTWEAAGICDKDTPQADIISNLNLTIIG